MPWPVHPNGLLGAQGDNDTYQISRSLRFNSADSAYLNRTNSASPTNAIKYTISVWAKRGSIGSNQNIIGVRNSATDDTYFRFTSTDEILLGSFSGSGTDYNITSSGVFRDPSAWYHIVCVFDSANLTQADRAILYVNGVRQAVTTPGNGMWPQDSTLNKINTASQGLNIGRRTLANDLHLNAYLTEFNFIDGQALTPSSFGETDAVTGRWKAKAYSGSYGTNGFYLKFADNSSTAALGTDSSGNGNTWTVNNFVVSPVDGAGNDSLVDSPTNYGSDSGVGGTVRGNYCTMNPLRSNATGNLISLSNGNLDTSIAAGTNAHFGASGTQAIISGKFYWEVTPTAISSSAGSWMEIGIIQSQLAYPVGSAIGSYNGGFAYTNDAFKARSGSYSAYGATWTTNDVIGVAQDADSGSITFYKNGISQGAAYTDLASYNLSAGYYPAIAVYRNTGITQSAVFNFGQRPFAYAAPSGFKALCTTNLSTPTIKKPSSYMDVVTYTGNGGTQTISSLGFSPDLVWLKRRNLADSNGLFDSVRGAGQRIQSNDTTAEVLRTDVLTSFDSNGFSITGSDTQSNFLNSTYVAWSWDAGSSSVTNNSGSITSTVRANAQDGVSVVSYTGTGANATVGHGLGVAPKMIIVKKRAGSIGSGLSDWCCYHANQNASPASGATFLNLTTAFTSDSVYWNNAIPTSSIFNIGTSQYTNELTNTYIAYCFAEIEGFSKFGSYTGNGSADGPFVYCGFRPRWIMIKRTDSTASWYIIDTARSTFNVTNAYLLPNASNTEATDLSWDILSNGFKLRSLYNEINTSNATMIFAAFAEQPFKYARAR